jgi:hypothetical protein
MSQPVKQEIKLQKIMHVYNTDRRAEYVKLTLSLIYNSNSSQDVCNISQFSGVNIRQILSNWL